MTIVVRAWWARMYLIVSKYTTISRIYKSCQLLLLITLWATRDCSSWTYIYVFMFAQSRSPGGAGLTLQIMCMVWSGVWIHLKSNFKITTIKHCKYNILSVKVIHTKWIANIFMWYGGSVCEYFLVKCAKFMNEIVGLKSKAYWFN